MIFRSSQKSLPCSPAITLNNPRFVIFISVCTITPALALRGGRNIVMRVQEGNIGGVGRVLPTQFRVPLVLGYRIIFYYRMRVLGMVLGT